MAKYSSAQVKRKVIEYICDGTSTTYTITDQARDLLVLIKGDISGSPVFRLPAIINSLDRVIAFKDQTGSVDSFPVKIEVDGGGSIENYTEKWLYEAAGYVEFYSKDGIWWMQSDESGAIAASFTSSSDQTIGAINTAVDILFPDTEFNDGLFFDEPQHYIQPTVDGSYQFELSPNIQQSSNQASVNFWIEVSYNGSPFTPYPKSTYPRTIRPNHIDAYLFSWLIQLTKDDKVKLRWESNDSGTVLYNQPPGTNAPSAPSAIVNVHRIK